VVDDGGGGWELPLFGQKPLAVETAGYKCAKSACADWRSSLVDTLTAWFYDGAYGPTLRIDVNDPGDQRTIYGMFRRLEAGELQATRLEEHVPATWTGAAGLTLEVIDAHRPPWKTVFRVAPGGDAGEEPAFLWIGTPEQWSIAGDFAQRLVEELRPGHQYLSAEGVDDGLIVLAFAERAMRTRT
jgi:hypothetical protein